MKIITLEEHFILPREEKNLPPGAQRGNDREKLLGMDIAAALLDVGKARLAAMDEAGIDVQVLSHNQPGCQALDAFPRLTFILGHLGEGLPFMLHRINDHTQLAAIRRGLKRTPAEYLTQNLVVTCSGNFSVPAFLCTVNALGTDNVLFSVDWPYESNIAGVEFLKRLPLAPHDLAKFAHKNAERILKL